MVEASTTTPIYDVLVLGGGFGGLHMVYELRNRGFSVIGLEAGDNVGGAWYWNRYPGARCDVESLAYCYSFSPIIDKEWKWSERYSGQKEIRAYLSWVADRLDIRKDYRFNSRIVKASYDKKAHVWTIGTESGDTYKARWFVTSPGPLATPIWPNIPDRETYKGQLIHSAKWPTEEPDFKGKRVGIIGTGSSATQIIPVVAEEASELTVFLRTPNFTTPANNGPLTEDDYKKWEEIRDLRRKQMRSAVRTGAGDLFMTDEMNDVRLRPASDFTKEQRQELFNRYWDHGAAVTVGLFNDVILNEATNEEICEFFRAKIKEIVKDPAKAEMLTPRGYPAGTRRIVVGSNFYETFNRDNVKIVDTKATPIERFSEKGVIVDGKELEFDIIISASGFDAVTGSLTVMDIRGADGQTLKDAWADGPHTFLGMAVNGFPNMLTVGSAGSPSVLSNVAMLNEIIVEWMTDLLTYARDNGIVEMEAEYDAQEKWTDTVNDLVNHTLLAKADSWYTGTNVPGKKRVILTYTGGLVNYRKACDESAANGYAGFKKVKADEPVAA